MSKRGKQKLKLIRIRDALLENTDEGHVMTVADIISYLNGYGIEAERKSIYEDIEELRAYGCDIITVRGKGGGFFIGKRTFETAELKLLVDAVQASRFITESKSRELIKALSSFASRHDRTKLSRQIHLPSRIKSMNESIYYTIDYIHTAINENCKIQFKYFRWNSKVQREERHGGRYYVVSPLFLIWDDENYYLAAYDSAAGIVKHYRVDKMKSISLLDEDRDMPKKETDIDSYSTALFGMFGGTPEYVRIECEERFADAIIDRFGRDVFIHPTENGFTCDVKVCVSPRFYAWVMGFGSGMKILYPDRVREGMKEMLRDISSRYEE